MFLVAPGWCFQALLVTPFRLCFLVLGCLSWALVPRASVAMPGRSGRLAWCLVVFSCLRPGLELIFWVPSVLASFDLRASGVLLVGGFLARYSLFSCCSVDNVASSRCYLLVSGRCSGRCGWLWGCPADQQAVHRVVHRLWTNERGPPLWVVPVRFGGYSAVSRPRPSGSSGRPVRPGGGLEASRRSCRTTLRSAGVPRATPPR